MKKSTAKRQTIVLVGGGSGGSVAPLLAVADALQKQLPTVRLFFIGSGEPERAMAAHAGLHFVRVTSARWRRFFSLRNVLAPVLVVVGFVQSLRLLRALKAEVVVGTGSFVQVPVAWAASLLGIPVVLHQQDVAPSLANRLCAPFARKMTVTFAQSGQDFPHGWVLKHLLGEDRVNVIGNPVLHRRLPGRTVALNRFRLDVALPTLLVMGGGTGALALNRIIAAALPRLTAFVNVLHITGAGRGIGRESGERYARMEFLADMEYAYAAADIVLCRAGLSTLAELAAYKKPAILVPMPDSHQEQNALLVSEREAALVVSQNALSADAVVLLARTFVGDSRLHRRLTERLAALMVPNAARKLAAVVVDALPHAVTSVPARASHLIQE